MSISWCIEDVETGRPKLYRDPVHGVIRYCRGNQPGLERENLGELVTALIDTPEFQRLRHIRQNGLANYVFQGMEHSRYAHSMGVAHVAAEMYDAIARNVGKSDEEFRSVTVVAALLHDCGHGPFSHTLEEVLGRENFDHEHMTVRYLTEPESGINQVLRTIDSSLPEHVATYIDKKRQNDPNWTHRLVSSQLDADRLDYARRDALMAGLEGHGFDYLRILDMLLCDATRVVVDERALDAVVQYLVALDNLYRSIYYHHACRAVSCLVTAILRRAKDIYTSDKTILPEGHPLSSLFENGQNLSLDAYTRLGEFQVWAALDSWRSSPDKTLSRLCTDLFSRTLPKPLRVSMPKGWETSKRETIHNCLREEAGKAGFSPDYDIMYDTPDRTAYKRPSFDKEENDPEQIWINLRTAGDPCPIEAVDRSGDTARTQLLKALQEVHYHLRFFVPASLREAAEKIVKEIK